MRLSKTLFSLIVGDTCAWHSSEHRSRQALPGRYGLVGVIHQGQARDAGHVPA